MRRYFTFPAQTLISVNLLWLLPLLIVQLFLSCNNDFLQAKYPAPYQATDTLLIDDSGVEKELDFELADAGNASWRIFQYPKGVEITPMEGHFSNGKSMMKIKVPNQLDVQPGVVNLPLILQVEGIGLMIYPLQCIHYGDPQFLWTGNFINFEYGSEQTFSFRSGNGVLDWEIKNKPAWLNVSKQKGILLPGVTEKLTFTVNRNALSDGIYKGVVTFTHNGEEKEFNLQVQMKVFESGLKGKIIPIPGNVVDADYCSSTGTTVLVATNPNRLIVINPGQSFKEMPFNSAPTTVSLTKNGEQAVCGFNSNNLSIIDLTTLSITKNFPLDCVPLDLSLGENGWAYLVPSAFMDYYLRSVNLSTGEIVKNPSDIRGTSKLLKVPGKNLIYGTKGGEWSNYFVVADISSGAASNIIGTWSFMPWNFWLSNDGNRVFSGNKNVYNSPAYQAKEWISDVPIVAAQMENLGTHIKSIEHSSVRKEIFAVYDWEPFETAAKIYRFNDETYLRQGFINVNECRIISSFGDLVTLRTELPWMFADRTGQKMVLIKKGLSQSTSDVYWFYESIDL